MIIFLSGGGTMGSVTPLLALSQELKRQCLTVRFMWIGTRGGPERKLVESFGMPFHSVYAGKWRRYVSFRNIIDPFLMLLGFFQSVLLIMHHRPAVIVSAGSFVSVPLVWAGFLLRVPCTMHQQDIRVGLANKLMQPFAKKITVTFQEQLTLFPSHKVVWTGNPVREEILQGDRAKAMQLLHLEEGIPTVLVTGGGTGAECLNNLVIAALPELTTFFQIIHLTGSYKLQPTSYNLQATPRYHQYDFLTHQMPHALAVADLVISRAGMGTLTELAALGKPAIVIPMPGTHQEDNAAFFAAHGAAQVLEQNKITPEVFIDNVRALLTNEASREALSRNIKSMMPSDAVLRMTDVVLSLL